MVDLAALKTEIDGLGEKIRQAKESGEGDVGALVQQLLTAKQTYADNNNGLGVDGQPYQPPLTKAQKKAKAKAEKEAAAAAAAAASGGGDAAPAAAENQDENQQSKGAQKKAAKKAAAKAKRDAMKQGGAAAAAAPEAGEAPAAAAAKPVPAAAKSANKPVLPPAGAAMRILPGQIAINPNVPLAERPVVAVAVAVLTNTIIDWELKSDHLSRHAVLCTTEGVAVTGDLAMARYLARQAPSSSFSILPSGAAEAASVDAWMDYAASLRLLDPARVIKAVAMTLQHALATQTYLAGHILTLADLALFSVLGFPSQAAELRAVLAKLPPHATAAQRWISMMAAHPALQEATQLCLGVTKNQEAIFDDTKAVMDPLVPGMNALEGGVAGRVVTRFPPEPSGYLHIGHAKAALLNDFYARRYQGRLILRFDDTNPSKEKEEYQESIVVDLQKLDIKPDLVTYTSDYLETILGHAKYLMQEGLAYMDDTPQEQMKTERENRLDSKHRNQSPEDALKYFDLMCSGSEEGANFCLRAKIDMKSNNGTMRDPVLYRQNLTPHHRSGTKYKAYPTYDLACPIVDSIEGVTHALRTTEYDDRNEQYQWVLKALGLRRPRNCNFSRVNFEYTVLSKRKLTWFVEKGYVTGWDDPRFPTVRGVVRRGIDIAALRSFMYAQGASKNVVNMVWHTFWANNKKEIDGKAKRFMAIDKARNTKLVVTNGPKEGDFAFRETTLHPKDPAMGTRVIRLCDTVLLENVDVEGIVVGEDIVLLRWGVVKITKINADGGLEGEHVPDGDFRAAKRKLSWIADVKNNCPVVLQEFDHLVTKAKFEEGDNFEDHITPTTMATTEVVGDAGLVTLKEHDIIQLERRGFYRVDKPYMGGDKPLMLIMVPDGRSKTMGGLEGKLAHH
eukprot:CAMPEP_0172445112 /NCGR_PEP_ID=MMETSP1065-20121228/5055_1 /TAXON_ID=265537 /ORGANISM="Amphiprora paludosa, Strain CCMP125" /LENGTH=900 /DNA_ID=CAMNT_0013195907 /DNA_START=60 /DNA_END=2762 /DNA_ORIENTATION=+